MYGDALKFLRFVRYNGVCFGDLYIYGTSPYFFSEARVSGSKFRVEVALSIQKGCPNPKP